jgi:hypothetical protein
MTRQDRDEVRAEDEDQKYPILSTVDRGARMTQLLEGHPVGRFTNRLAARALICAVAWALAFSPICAAYLGLAPTSVGSVWAVAVSLVIAYVALCLTMGLYEDTRTTFGQDRFSGVLTSAVVCGGFAGSTGGWLIASFSIEPQPAFDLHNIATSPTIPRELLAIVGASVALWAAFALARLGPALRHARSRQQTIDRLRHTGTRHAGEISERDFRGVWRRNDPLFRLQVTYTAQGENRLVPVRMRTSHTRVPVVGSPVVVLADDSGSVHVELDRSVRIEFEDEDRYAPPDG